MNMEELKKFHNEKEHLMRNEGIHPANHSEKHRRMRESEEEMNHEIYQERM